MPEIVCVEPAIDFNASVRRVSANDSLVFPHVDSCMSVTLMVSPDVLIGGHAGMMDHQTYEMQADVNLSDMLTRMINFTAGRRVVRAIFVGNDDTAAPDGENWGLNQAFAQVRNALNNQSLPCVRVNTSGTGKGVDVFFDNGPMRLRVQHYQFEAGRADLGVPTRRAYALDVPYHAIRDADVS